MGLETERREKIMANIQRLRTAVLDATDYETFEMIATRDILPDIDVFDLLDEFNAQGGTCLVAYYRNMKGVAHG
ncbi:MAG: hypothetical protein AB7E96_12210 [Deferribacterales bacterium]